MDSGVVALLSALAGGVIGAGSAISVQVMTAIRAKREGRRTTLHNALVEFVRVGQDAQETIIHARNDEGRKQRATAAVWVAWRTVLLAAPNSEVASATYQIADIASNFMWTDRTDQLLPAINPLWRSFELEAIAALEAIDRGYRPARS